MIALRINAAHGWQHKTRHQINYRVDYYAIGNPKLVGLFSAITSEEGLLPRIVIETAPEFIPEKELTTSSDFAAHWAEMPGDANFKETGEEGGELLDDRAVLMLAACHPDWFSTEDLFHLLAVAEEKTNLSKDDWELEAARDDLKLFVSALYGIAEEGGVYDG